MTTKPTLYWHIHHEILIEETTNIQERIDYIRANKPEKEIPLRLKLMTPVLHPEKLPSSFRKAREDYDKAREAYCKAWEAYDKAWEAYDKAGEAYCKAGDAYDKAREAYCKAGEAYDKAREAYIMAGKDYDKAWEVYIKTSKACAPQIEKLHKEEHPDCPWNGKTIFSEVD